MISLDKCNGSCNNVVDDLSAIACVTQKWNNDKCLCECKNY